MLCWVLPTVPAVPTIPAVPAIPAISAVPVQLSTTTTPPSDVYDASRPNGCATDGRPWHNCFTKSVWANFNTQGALPTPSWLPSATHIWVPISIAPTNSRVCARVFGCENVCVCQFWSYTRKGINWIITATSNPNIVVSQLSFPLIMLNISLCAECRRLQGHESFHSELLSV